MNTATSYGTIDSLFPNSIVSRIKRGEVTLQQVIMDKSIFNSIKRSSKILTEFIVSQKDEFINILTSSDNVFLQNSAIKILGCGNKAIVNAVVNSDKLKDYGENIKDASDIKKFPSIIEICLSSFPESINDNLSFVPNLCNFVDNSSITYMFEKLLQPIDKLKPVHQYFKSIDFPNTVAQAALKVNKNSEKQIGLISVLLSCLNCPILEDCSTNSATLDLVRDCVESDDPYIQSLAWKFAETAVIIGDNDEIYASAILDQAVTAITTLEPRVYREYQVNALKFLMKLISLRQCTANEIDSDLIVKTMKAILKDYPAHSIALTAVFDFTKVALDNPFIHTKFMEGFVPSVAAVILDDDSNRTQKAFCTSFMRTLKKISEQDCIIDEEITPEVRESFSNVEDYETQLFGESIMRKENIIDDMIDGLDIPLVGVRPIISSQDF